jgi:hypothetical protein
MYHSLSQTGFSQTTFFQTDDCFTRDGVYQVDHDVFVAVAQSLPFSYGLGLPLVPAVPLWVKNRPIIICDLREPGLPTAMVFISFLWPESDSKSQSESKESD